MHYSVIQTRERLACVTHITSKCMNVCVCVCVYIKPTIVRDDSTHRSTMYYIQTTRTVHTKIGLHLETGDLYKSVSPLYISTRSKYIYKQGCEHLKNNKKGMQCPTSCLCVNVDQRCVSFNTCNMQSVPPRKDSDSLEGRNVT